MQRIRKDRGICTNLCQRLFCRMDYLAQLASKLCMYIIVHFIQIYIALMAVKHERESEIQENRLGCVVRLIKRYSIWHCLCEPKTNVSYYYSLTAPEWLHYSSPNSKMFLFLKLWCATFLLLYTPPSLPLPCQ